MRTLGIQENLNVMPRVKKVVITLPVLLVGGTEFQTLLLTRTLVNADYQVTVCCFYDHNRNMKAAMEAAGAQVVVLNDQRSAGLRHLFLRLMRFFMDQKPDAVHVQYIAPGFVPVLAAKLARVPTIFATVHQPGRVYGLKAKCLLKTAAVMCTAFVCVSLSAERSWFGNSMLFEPSQSLRSRKHWTIYNAVDIDKIGKAVKDVDRAGIKHELGISDKPVMGVVARLRSEKGHAFLFECLGEVKKKIPAAVLLVVGDGPDRSRLEMMAQRLSLQKNILWLGEQTHDDLLKLYAIMDLVVVPSQFEGFGLVAVEAMAARLPVIANRVDGLSEIVQDGLTGYLVSPGDKTALGEKIIDLLSYPEKAKRYGENGHDRVMKFFSTDRYESSIRSLYESCAR